MRDRVEGCACVVLRERGEGGGGGCRVGGEVRRRVMRVLMQGRGKVAAIAAAAARRPRMRMMRRLMESVRCHLHVILVLAAQRVES